MTTHPEDLAFLHRQRGGREKIIRLVVRGHLEAMNDLEKVAWDSFADTYPAPTTVIEELEMLIAFIDGPCRQKA